jgi:hypothetical protein
MAVRWRRGQQNIRLFSQASTAAESPECHFSAVAQIECDAEHNFFTLLRVG